MQINDVKTDLHMHGWCGWTTGIGQGIMSKLGETGERSLEGLSERCFQEKQNTLVSFVNFNDTRYEGLVNTRKTLPKDYGLYDDYKEVFVGVEKNGLWNLVIRGQEIPTEKGHILIIGGNRTIESRRFEEVLEEAEDMNALKIADHPLAEYGILGKIWTLGGRLSIGEDKLKMYNQNFNAIEVGNSNFPKLTEETEKLAWEIGLGKVCSSDSHVLEDAFSSYMSFPELDFSNADALRQDLKSKLSYFNNCDYVVGTNKNNGKAKHLMAVVYNITRQKLGLIKESQDKIE